MSILINKCVILKGQGTYENINTFIIYAIHVHIFVMISTCPSCYTNQRRKAPGTEIHQGYIFLCCCELNCASSPNYYVGVLTPSTLEGDFFWK